MLTFVIAFAVLTSGIASAGAVARVFGGRYLQEFVSVPALPVAILFVFAIALVNLRGISESIKLNMFLTLVELSGLLLIIAVGIATLAGGQGDPGRAFTFKPDVNVAVAVLAGAAVAFYACLGFEDVANVAEEAENPVKMLPIALIVGLGIAGVIYVAVSFTAAMVVDPATLAKSSGPLLEVVKAGPVPISPSPLFGHRLDGRHQHGAHQHDHGLPSPVWHGPAGGHAADARLDAPDPADPLGGHRVHHASRPGPGDHW